MGIKLLIGQEAESYSIISSKLDNVLANYYGEKRENNELRNKIDRLEDDILDARKVSDLDLEERVLKKTSSLREENLKLTIENNKLKAQNDILNKAFSQLGFDIKSMGDMLNKLVDGIVSKNTINVVK